MGRISEESIEQVAAANDIVEVIGGYLKLSRAGSNYKALCPFHNEKTPSFIVNPARQTYKCFGCGAGGSVFRFLMEYEHVDFVSAVRRLAERGGVPLVEDASSPGEERRRSERDRLLALLSAATAWFETTLHRSKDAEHAREYLKRRGIGGEVAKEWRIGFAPDSWDSLMRWAESEGYGVRELLEAGLVTPRGEEAGQGAYDRFRNRIMFPICDDLGNVIAFSGRTLENNPKSAKYVNSPETPVFTKGKVLFGLHQSKRDLIQARSAIVCEGQIDVIKLFTAGFRNVVAPQGTAFTDRQAAILKRFVERVFLCFDSDKAGVAAAERSFAPLLEVDLDVAIIAMPAGEDPDSYIASHGSEGFQDLLDDARDFFDFLVDHAERESQLNSPRDLARLTERIRDNAALVGNPVVRDNIVGRMAARLGVSPENLRSRSRKQEKPIPTAATQQRTLTRNHVEHLVYLACRCPDARATLLETDWQTRRHQLPEADLLWLTLSANIDPSNPHTVNAFLHSLEESQERRMQSILDSNYPTDGVEDIWYTLLASAMRRRLEALSAKLHDRSLNDNEMIAIQKEMLDLKKQLPHIPRLSSTENS